LVQQSNEVIWKQLQIAILPPELKIEFAYALEIITCKMIIAALDWLSLF
jgi:hypothetical protein